MKIRKDDTVLITAGKDKGKTGQGRAHRAQEAARLRRGPEHRQAPHAPDVGQGHLEGAQVGGIIEKEGPIDISNVMLVDPDDNKPTRVRIERTEDGKRKRISATTGKGID